MSSKRPLNVLLVGFYGRGNFGDDLMCHSLVRHLISKTSANIEISTENSDYFRELVSPRVNTVGRSSAEIVKALLKTDFLIQGGGTIFHDSYRFPQLFFYWRNLTAWVLLLFLARLMGARVMIVGAGIGPISHVVTRVLTLIALNLSNFVSVRDVASQKTVAAISRKKVMGGFDLAAVEPHSPYHREKAAGDALTIGVSPCDLDLYHPDGSNEAFWQPFSEAISEIASDRPIDIVFLSLFSGGKLSDEAISRRVALGMKNVRAIDFKGYVGTLEDIIIPMQQCDVLIAARFHAAVAGYLAGCKLIVAAYNRKVADFADEIRLAPARILPTDVPLTCDEWKGVLMMAIGTDNGSTLPIADAIERARRGLAPGIQMIANASAK
jgi:polysaccharide pyruvyl transferase WcaK-like protein